MCAENFYCFIISAVASENYFLKPVDLVKEMLNDTEKECRNADCQQTQG